MPENDEPKERCPTCGEECEPDEIRDCPYCERPGCDYCMPSERGCSCPECDEEDDG